jgi:potassium/chloride transporter 9
MATMTALSIAAISTNGLMKGGGAYYMISRCLGPELGGACGVMFYCATSFSVSFYLVAFAQTFEISFFSEEATYQGTVTISSVALFVLFFYGNMGADIFLKFDTLIFALLMVSIVAGYVALFVGGDKEFFLSNSGAPTEAVFNSTFAGICNDGVFDSSNPESCVAEIGPSTDILRDNLLPEGAFDRWPGTFIVLFPSVTGIMAGANYSGDLADPGYSLGRGTLSAIACSLLVYLTFALLFAATTPYEILREDYNALQAINDVGGGAFVYLGVFASTISSGLGQMVGSARVMQALAKDNLIPVLKPLAWGSKVGNEPRKALVLSWCVAQSLIMIGDIAVLAEIVSMFYLLVYSFINLCCLTLTVSGAPNFRPRFQYYSWHTALLGFACSLTAMFLANALYASVAWVLVIAITLYISSRSPSVEWGDNIGQALIYHQVRKYLLRLDVRKAHAKIWRPQIQLLVDHPQSALSLIDFCNNLKKGGLYMLSNVVVGTLPTRVEEHDSIQKKWLDLIDKSGIKAFFNAAINTDVADGFSSLIVNSGLGGMAPNTIVMQEFRPSDPDSAPLPFGRADSSTTASQENSRRLLGGIQKVYAGCTDDKALTNAYGLFGGNTHPL